MKEDLLQKMSYGWIAHTTLCADGKAFNWKYMFAWLERNNYPKSIVSPVPLNILYQLGDAKYRHDPEKPRVVILDPFPIRFTDLSAALKYTMEHEGYQILPL